MLFSFLLLLFFFFAFFFNKINRILHLFIGGKFVIENRMRFAQEFEMHVHKNGELYINYLAPRYKAFIRTITKKWQLELGCAVDGAPSHIPKFVANSMTDRQTGGRTDRLPLAHSYHEGKWCRKFGWIPPSGLGGDSVTDRRTDDGRTEK